MTWLSAPGTAGRWPARAVNIRQVSGLRSRFGRPSKITPLVAEHRFAGQRPAVVRPTAHINSEVQVLAGEEASIPVSEPNCVAVRLRGEQGDENQWPVGVRT
jgi:hypothetical protein